MGFVTDLKSSSRLGLLVAASAATVGVIYGYDQSNIAGALLPLTAEFDLSTHDQELVTTAGRRRADRRGARRRSAGQPDRAQGVDAAGGVRVRGVLAALRLGVLSADAARRAAAAGGDGGRVDRRGAVFVAESAPTKVRGAMLVLYQVATVVGIIAGYLVAWAFAGAGSWRLLLGLAAVPAALVVLMLLRLPDTARWYMLRGRRDDARRVLTELDPDIDPDLELAEIDSALSEERGGGIKELLRMPWRRATVFVVVLGFFIQITGINAIVYYSPRIFESMGFSGEAALLGLPALVQVFGLAAVLTSLVTVDRFGRKPTLLTGIAIMVVANALLIVVFLLSSSFGGVLTLLGFIGLVLFTVGFTFGFGSLVWVYAGESFPARLRAPGASAMLTADLVANAVVAALFLTMLNGLGGAGTFAVFGVLALAAMVFVHRQAPETKGRRLDEIQQYWENDGQWVK